MELVKNAGNFTTQTKNKNMLEKKIKVKIGKRTIEKEVVFLIGRGENCKCSDCLVLYGGDCPFDIPKVKNKNL